MLFHRQAQRHVQLRRLALAAVAAIAALIIAITGTLAGSDLLPAATALPCPDGSQTCGPQPTQDPGPTQGNQGPTTAPQAPQTTIPPNADAPAQTDPTQGNGGFQGTVQAMPTPDNPNGCIVNCGPTQTGAPTTAQAPPSSTPQQPSTPTQTSPERPREESTQNSVEYVRQKCAEVAEYFQITGSVFDGMPEVTGGGPGRTPIAVRDPNGGDKGPQDFCTICPDPGTYPLPTAYDKIGPHEQTACSSFPTSCINSRNTANQADTEARKYFPGKSADSRQDAARHCIWSALMTRKGGIRFALVAGDAHELDNRLETNPHAGAMDKHNNGTGRGIGYGNQDSDSTIINKCVTLAREAVYVPNAASVDRGQYHGKLIFISQG